MIDAKQLNTFNTFQILQPDTNMRSIRDLYFLSRAFLRYARGKDYFHQKQGLGHYFHDKRCYYNDLTKKADWKGKTREGVPVLDISAGNTMMFPGTIMLFGLGSIDKYFLESRQIYLDQARAVCRWMINSLLPQGYYEHHWDVLDAGKEYYSNNSAMSQGLSLSFASRIIDNALADSKTCQELEKCMELIKTNMLAPISREGTTLQTDHGPVLMEFCCKSHNIVLNGWIFALFGLIDYSKHRVDSQISDYIEATLLALIEALPSFSLVNGWSYYDSLGRITSPFYHSLHVSLLDAMYRITNQDVFRQYMEMFRRSNHSANRIRYTLVKIIDKLFDKDLCLKQ